jgi:hypothetical protein
MPALNALEKSQQKIFRSLKHELELIERNKSEDIRVYERAFRASLPSTAKSATKRELVLCAQRSQVILVGDFHPFRQSQKGFLRLLEDSWPPRASVGLECVPIDRQASLESFYAGNITAEELREEIDFDREWPFSWESYKEILEYCRSHRIPLYALNLAGNNLDPGLLYARDEAASQIVAEVVHGRAGSRMFVLFGELHLARPHLPARLRELGCSTLVVHQNETSLYWKAPKTKNGQRAEVLRLRKDEYCVQNSVPWVKIRSYLDWLEGDESWEDGYDLSGSLQNFADLLAKTLGIPPSSADLFAAYGSDEFEERAARLGPEEKALLRHSRTLRRTTMLPVKKALLLPTMSTNALAEGASLLLWGSSQKMKTAPASGSRLISQFMVGYLGSKILNPKRKCNEVADLREFLERRGQGRKRAVVRRALTLLQKHLKIGKFGSLPLPSTAEIEACRLAGYILGNRLFHALMKDNSLMPFVRSVYGSSNASTAWADHLLKEVSSRITRVSPPRKSEGF